MGEKRQAPQSVPFGKELMIIPRIRPWTEVMETAKIKPFCDFRDIRAFRLSSYAWAKIAEQVVNAGYGEEEGLIIADEIRRGLRRLDDTLKPTNKTSKFLIRASLGDSVAGDKLHFKSEEQ